MNLWNFAHQIVRNDESTSSIDLLQQRGTLSSSSSSSLSLSSSSYPSSLPSSSCVCKECECLIPSSLPGNRKHCFSCLDIFCLKCSTLEFSPAFDIKSGECSPPLLCRLCAQVASVHSSQSSTLDKDNYTYEVDLSLYCAQNDILKLLQMTLTSSELDATTHINVACVGLVIQSIALTSGKPINVDHKLRFDIRFGLGNVADIHFIAIKSGGKKTEINFAKTRIALHYCCLNQCASNEGNVSSLEGNTNHSWLVRSSPILIKPLKHDSGQHGVGQVPQLRWRARLATSNPVPSINGDRPSKSIGSLCQTFVPLMFVLVREQSLTPFERCIPPRQLSILSYLKLLNPGSIGSVPRTLMHRARSHGELEAMEGQDLPSKARAYVPETHQTDCDLTHVLDKECGEMVLDAISGVRLSIGPDISSSSSCECLSDNGYLVLTTHRLIYSKSEVDREDMDSSCPNFSELGTIYLCFQNVHSVNVHANWKSERGVCALEIGTSLDAMSYVFSQRCRIDDAVLSVDISSPLSSTAAPAVSPTSTQPNLRLVQKLRSRWSCRFLRMWAEEISWYKSLDEFEVSDYLTTCNCAARLNSKYSASMTNKMSPLGTLSTISIDDSEQHDSSQDFQGPKAMVPFQFPDEFDRQSLSRCGFWRQSSVNQMLDICTSYPTTLAVPRSVNDSQLRKAATQRVSGRIPVLTWLHPNGASLCRASQPLTGIRDTFGLEDDLLLLEMQRAVTRARSTSSGKLDDQESCEEFNLAERSSSCGHDTLGCTVNMQAAEDDDFDDPWTHILVEKASSQGATANANFSENRCGLMESSSLQPLGRNELSNQNSILSQSIHRMSLQESIELATSTRLVPHLADSVVPDDSFAATAQLGTDSSAGESVELANQKSPVPIKSSVSTYQFLRIIDCRDLLSAQGNVILGKGFENVSRIGNYVSIQFEGIGNIHTMRESYRSLRVACWRACVSMVSAGTYDMEVSSMWDAAVPSMRTLQSPVSSGTSFLQAVVDSKWLHHLSDIIRASIHVCTHLHRREPVLVHCSDGWDRTAQVCALSQLLLEPYYRTIWGFKTLIEKEFVSFGHQFRARSGIQAGVAYSKAAEGFGPPGRLSHCSPIFLQFLDCVWQVWRQFPHKFEFNEAFLVFLAKSHNSGSFIEFICNTMSQRESRQRNHANQRLNLGGTSCNPVNFRIASIWSWVQSSYSSFENVLFENRVDTWPASIVPNMSIGTIGRVGSSSTICSPYRAGSISSMRNNSGLFLNRTDSFVSDGQKGVPHFKIDSSKDSASVVHLSPVPAAPKAQNSSCLDQSSLLFGRQSADRVVDAKPVGANLCISPPFHISTTKQDRVVDPLQPICCVQSLVIWEAVHWHGFSSLLPCSLRGFLGMGSARVEDRLRDIVDDQRLQIISLRQKLAIAEQRAKEAEQLLSYSQAHPFAPTVTEDSCFADDQIEFVTRMESPFVFKDSFR